MSAEPVRVTNYLDAADTHSSLDAVRALGARRGGARRRADHPRPRPARRRRPAPRSTSATPARCCGCCPAGSPGRTAAAGRSTATRASAAARSTASRSRSPRWARSSRRATGASRRSRSPGGRLHGIEYALPVASAQIKSCLLLAGPARRGRDHRRRARAEPRPHRAAADRRRRRPDPRRRPDHGHAARTELALEAIHVPGDPSSAAFHVAAAVLVPGSRLTVTRDGRATGPASASSASSSGWARRSPARSRTRATAAPDTEPLATLEVAHGPLTATRVTADEVPLAIDELPLVALLGCFAEGETVVEGAQELRLKESDRIATVVDGLRGLGADIEATADGFAVRGTGGLRGRHDRGPRRPPAGDARRGRRAGEPQRRRGRRDGGRRGLLPGLRRRSGRALTG